MLKANDLIEELHECINDIRQLKRRSMQEQEYVNKM